MVSGTMAQEEAWEILLVHSWPLSRSLTHPLGKHGNVNECRGLSRRENNREGLKQTPGTQALLSSQSKPGGYKAQTLNDHSLLVTGSPDRRALKTN